MTIPPVFDRRAGAPWAFDPWRHRHVVIVGHGRSGTNLALDLFDAHPNTICRNEPNNLPDGALSHLTGEMGADPGENWSIDAWSAALSVAGCSHGGRDRRDRGYKCYYRSAADRVWVESILSRPRIRAALRPLMPGLRRAEWGIASHLGSRIAATPPVPVFKILLQPHWVAETHYVTETQYVAHVMRDAPGFIASWMNRYVIGTAGGDQERVFSQNLATIDPILARFGGVLRHGRAFSAEALIESELWRWRFMNETVHDALNGSERYRPLRYRDLVEAPAVQGEELLRWIGLETDAGTRRRVAEMKNTLFSRAHSRLVDADMVSDIAGHVLAASPIAPWVLTSGG